MCSDMFEQKSPLPIVKCIDFNPCPLKLDSKVPGSWKREMASMNVPSKKPVCSGLVQVTLTVVLLLTSVAFSRGETLSCPKPGQDFVNSLSMKMVWIESGAFTMGTDAKEVISKENERPSHKVVVRNGFWMGQTEVSQNQYFKIMRKNPSVFKGDSHPVSSVSFASAVTFCERLNEEASHENVLPSGYVYSLPTETQWEYAARTSSLGDDIMHSIDSEKAGWNSNSILREGFNGSFHHRPCGTSPSNERSLFDLYGNVWEWCLDNYHPSYSGSAFDERPWYEQASPENKVIRGGSYLSLPNDCLPVRRSSRSIHRESDSQGFRVVLSVRALHSIERHSSSPAIEKQANQLNQSIDGGLQKKPSSQSPADNEKEIGMPSPEKPTAASTMENSIGMRFVWIPPGKIEDGSSETGEVEEGFWLGSCEVSQKHYEMITGKNPSHFRGDERPVENVSYGDAQRFCKALSEKDKRQYRLPGMIEWKRALMANSKTPVYGDVKDIGWVKGVSTGRISTKPVGLKTPNGYGLFDMIGNVSEWAETPILQLKGFGKGERAVSGFICSSADMGELMKKYKCGGNARTPRNGVDKLLFVKADAGSIDNYTGFRVLCVYQEKKKTASVEY